MRIDWNMKGFEELLSGDDIAEELNAQAEAIASRANSAGKGTFEALPATFRKGGRRAGRARAAVRTADLEAIKAEATDHVLLKAIDGGA